MCLQVKEGTLPKIAKKDIVCYKHLITTSYGYFTTYMHEKVELGNTYSSKLDPIVYNEINMGLHSFSSLKSTILDAKDELKPYFSHTYIIVKCVIPKGATYYKGTFQTRECVNSYVSDQITYTNQILKTIARK